MHCPQDHPVVPGDVFCSTCGAAVEAAPSVARCSGVGHHPMQPGDQFCGVCGAPQAPPDGVRERGPGVTPVARPVAALRAGQGVWLRLSGRWKLVSVLGLLALGLIVATSVGSRQGGGGSYDAAPAEPSSTTTLASPNLKCVDAVYATVADIINNSDAGFQRELAVGGINNPVFHIATSLTAVFYQEQNSNGRLAAQSAVTRKAADLCSAAGDPNNDAYGGTPYTPPDNVNG